MLTTRRLLLGLAVTALAFPAAAQELPDRIKQAGKIVIATMPNYPPITYKDPATSKLMGLDIDLGEAIAKELGVKVEWQEIAFAQMLPSLQTGRVDLVMAGMSDLPTRRDQQDFVDYMRSGAQFYTSVAMSKEIKSQADLCGKKVGASRSTNWPKQIEEWSQANCVAKGKPAITVIGTEGSIDARTQLKQQRIDAGVQGSETLPYLQTQEPNTYVILGEPFTVALSGIPVLKTEPKLRESIKAALDSLQKKGIYDQILEKHGLKAAAQKPITINQGT
ncbi:MAG TPA: ABC transporter substrate-binding protein [Alphaproteobacteria bacterium]|nr:ABC transporter substrate-binding protein [Alphaproteobacteria bacterium]